MLQDGGVQVWGCVQLKRLSEATKEKGQKSCSFPMILCLLQGKLGGREEQRDFQQENQVAVGGEEGSLLSTGSK